MDAKLARILEELDESRKDLDRSVAAIPADKHMVSPGSDRWSVAQILEHLLTVEQRITGLLRKLLSEARENAAAPSPSPRTFDSARVRDRSNKIKTRMGDPAGATSVADSLEALDQARRELKAVVSDTGPVSLANVSAPHQVFGTLDGHDWLAFVASHMHRHAEQIRELSH
ncbi:MAG TPA: DinB family protein [Gemmatimonadaceae bacterium]|jgi:hypothetical protein